MTYFLRVLTIIAALGAPPCTSAQVPPAAAPGARLDFNDVLPCLLRAARYSHSDPSRLVADLLERCKVDLVFNHRDHDPDVNLLGNIFTIATNDGRFDTAWADEHCKLVLSGIRCEWNGYVFNHRR